MLLPANSNGNGHAHARESDIDHWIAQKDLALRHYSSCVDRAHAAMKVWAKSQTEQNRTEVVQARAAVDLSMRELAEVHLALRKSQAALYFASHGVRA